jgi:Class III cytochrome C family
MTTTHSRGILLGATIVVALVVLCSLPRAEADDVAPEGVHLLKMADATKPGVKFDHAQHTSTTCVKCHHLGQMDQKCSDCHGLVDQGPVISAQLAYHTNCMECHIEGGEAAGKAQECLDCHKE